MKLRKAIAAVLLLASTTAGSAQEAIPTRVVIAPAVSPAAKLLKARLSEARDARSEAAQDLYFFYCGRGFEPVWLTGNEQSWTVNSRTQALVDLFKGFAALGLDLVDYAVGAKTVATIEDAVGYELALMSSALRFGLDNYGGRLDPRAISPNLDMPKLKPESGCVRVEQVETPISRLLRDNGGWDLPSVQAAFDGGTEDNVALNTQMPIHTTYITAWANRQGTVSFRDDVYGERRGSLVRLAGDPQAQPKGRPKSSSSKE